MMKRPQLIHAGEVAPQPWRNGAGRTRELLTWPAGPQPWQLRISLAEISRDGPFSLYPGIERWISVIEGAGVRLLLEGREHRLDCDSKPLRFDGALPVSCTLIDGPGTDLNLMHAGGRAAMIAAHSAVAWISALPQRGLFTRTAGLWSAGDAQALHVPAHCLLWLDEAANISWTFRADSTDAAAPALWLGFMPAAAVYHRDARIQT
jgi:environmental stress-induced protein Ves